MTDPPSPLDQAATDTLITRLHAEGAAIIETIKAVRTECGVSLGDAKTIVAHHPLWHSVHAAAVPFHDEIIAALQKEARTDPSINVQVTDTEFEVRIALTDMDLKP